MRWIKGLLWKDSLDGEDATAAYRLRHKACVARRIGLVDKRKVVVVKKILVLLGHLWCLWSVGIFFLVCKSLIAFFF